MPLGDPVQIIVSEATYERLSRLRVISGNELTFDQVINILIDYRRE